MNGSSVLGLQSSVFIPQGRENPLSRDYKKLRAWQLANNLAVLVYKTTQEFPRSEVFGLTAQIRRAAVSVPANIVEGSARKHQKEFVQFLYVALSSLTELRYYFDLSRELGYLGNGSYNELKGLGVETVRQLQGLISYFEQAPSRRRPKTDLPKTEDCITPATLTYQRKHGYHS